MYRPKHFSIEELVPPAVFTARGAAAFELLDERLLIELDNLRTVFGPVILNTWHSAALQKRFGLRTESVLRVDGTTVGAKFSQHKFGRAADCLFTAVSVADVRRAVLASPEKFPHITALEDGVSWFHFDVRNCAPIKVFKA